MTRPLLIFTAETDGGETLFCPFFRCATCGERITDARYAIAILECDDHGRYSGAITVVHKGTCDRYPGHPWRSLGELLSQLAFNSDVDLETRR